MQQSNNFEENSEVSDSKNCLFSGVKISKEQNIQALAKWLKVDPCWLRYGGVLADSFVADYMSLSEGDKATVRAVIS